MIQQHNTADRATSRRSARAGLTLLELMLALALSVLLVAAISMAFNLYLNSLNVGRAQVEESQLARAVLQKISDDLRAAVYYEPVEPPRLKGSSSGQSDESSQDTGGGGSTDNSGGGNSSPGSGGGNSSTGSGGGNAQQSNDSSASDSADDSALTEEDADEPETDIANSTAVMSQPGLVGTQYELQIDVGRLPRVDQYQAMVASTSTGELADIPSDVKTVAYYVRLQADPYTNRSSTAGLGDSKESFLEFSGGIGLVRRELDYSVTRWAADSGQTQGLDQNGHLLAPEITYLEFRYFDGTEWLTEWNSQEMGGLPKAVEIVIVVASQRKSNRSGAVNISSITGQQTTGREYVYRKVVHLPSSVAPSVAEEEEFEDLGL